MARISNVLLVEGDSDRKLLEEICKDLKLNTNVRVAPPQDFDSKERNSKGSMFNMLPTFVQQMADGQIKRFAAIMDADHISPEGGGGMGCAGTIKNFSDVVGKFSFSRVQRAGQPDGVFFGHNNGLSDIGLWVMPDNRKDGMMEDWFRTCISKGEDELISTADRTVSSLPKPIKFKDIHVTKAQVATWLAWQKMPGQGMHRAYKNDLIDKESENFVKLTRWLNYLFA